MGKKLRRSAPKAIQLSSSYFNIRICLLISHSNFKLIMSKKRKYPCTVRTCNKKYANGLFAVPKDNRFKKWNDLLKLDPSIKKHQICKEHFALDDLCDGDERLKLRKNALPSINLPTWVRLFYA